MSGIVITIRFGTYATNGNQDGDNEVTCHAGALVLVRGLVLEKSVLASLR